MNIYLSNDDIVLIGFNNSDELAANEAAVAELRTAMPNNKVIVLTGSPYMTQISPPSDYGYADNPGTVPMAGHPQIERLFAEGVEAVADASD